MFGHRSHYEQTGFLYGRRCTLNIFTKTKAATDVVFVALCLFEETKQLFTTWVEFIPFRNILEDVFVLQNEW